MDVRFDLAARSVGYRSAARYQFRGRFLFDGISLNRARVLEVGSGTGAWAIWAALHGATEVVAIEPEEAGSAEHSLTNLKRNIELLGLQGAVKSKGCTLQKLSPSEGPFDVVVKYNVINHLDEKSVVCLHLSEEAD